MNSYFIWLLISQPKQRICLSRSSLPISKYTYVFTIYRVLNQLGKLSKDMLLGIWFAKNLLKYVALFEFLRLRSIPFFLICYFESIFWSHWDYAFSFLWRSYPTVDSNISLDLLQIIVEFFLKNKHLLILKLILIQQLVKANNLFFLPLALFL